MSSARNVVLCDPSAYGAIILPWQMKIQVGVFTQRECECMGFHLTLLHGLNTSVMHRRNRFCIVVQGAEYFLATFVGCFGQLVDFGK